MPIDLNESLKNASSYLFGNTIFGFDFSNSFVTALLITIILTLIVILFFNKKSIIAMVFSTLLSSWIIISAHDNIIYNNLRKPNDIMRNIASEHNMAEIFDEKKQESDIVKPVKVPPPKAAPGAEIDITSEPVTFGGNNNRFKLFD